MNKNTKELLGEGGISLPKEVKQNAIEGERERKKRDRKSGRK